MQREAKIREGAIQTVGIGSIQDAICMGELQVRLKGKEGEILFSGFFHFLFYGELHMPSLTVPFYRFKGDNHPHFPSL